MDWSGDSAAEISTHGPFIFFISVWRQKGAHELSQAAPEKEKDVSRGERVTLGSLQQSSMY